MASYFRTELRVGPLSPPLLEDGYTDCDAVWFLAYLIGSPVSLRRNHQSTYRRFAGMHVLTDRQTTDRQHSDNTDSLASSHESAIKSEHTPTPDKSKDMAARLVFNTE